MGGPSRSAVFGPGRSQGVYHRVHCKPPAAARLRGSFRSPKGGHILQGPRDRIALGIHAAEDLDLPLGPFQQLIRLPQELDPFLVADQGFAEPQLAVFQQVDDFFQPLASDCSKSGGWAAGLGGMVALRPWVSLP